MMFRKKNKQDGADSAVGSVSAGAGGGMSDQPSKATTPEPEPEHTALKPMSSTSMTEEGIVYLDGVKLFMLLTSLFVSMFLIALVSSHPPILLFHLMRLVVVS
jgi:hypothetical protein